MLSTTEVLLQSMARRTTQRGQTPSLMGRTMGRPPRILLSQQRWTSTGMAATRNNNRRLVHRHDGVGPRTTTSSSKKQHSTTTMDFSQTGELSTASELANAPRPPWKALRALFVASAIPMVGFGFMDNLVMIQAGQYIDSTIGVSLGLATMSAAAAGQVVSDVSGVVFGGTLERFLIRLSFIEAPALTMAQRQLSICRNVSMAGAVIGVVIGCALGATTLLLVDLDARDRIERATRLREIVTDMVSEEEDGNGVSSLNCETCCIYVASAHDFHVETVEEDKKWRTSLKLLHDSESQSVKDCEANRKTILDDTRDFLYTPVMDGDDVIAVLEFHYSRRGDNGPTTATPRRTKAPHTGFTDEDVRTAKVMARHLAIFMNRLVE